VHKVFAIFSAVSSSCLFTFSPHHFYLVWPSVLQCFFIVFSPFYIVFFISLSPLHIPKIFPVLVAVLASVCLGGLKLSKNDTVKTYARTVHNEAVPDPVRGRIVNGSTAMTAGAEQHAKCQGTSFASSCYTHRYQIHRARQSTFVKDHGLLSGNRKGLLAQLQRTNPVEFSHGYHLHL